MGTPSLKLRNPRFRIITGDPDNPDTWTAYDVQTIGPDFQRVEQYFAGQRGNVGITDQPILGTVLSAFYALTRTGQIAESFEDFQTRYIEVQTTGEDNPSPTEPDPASG